MDWKWHIQELKNFINSPSPIKRPSAQYHLEALEDMMDKRERKERRDQEELDSWCDRLEAELLNPDVLQAIQKARR